MFTYKSKSIRDLYFQLSCRNWRTCQSHRQSRTL